MEIAISHYLQFVCACMVLLIVPGPDLAFLLGRTIAQGRKAGIFVTLGLNFGAYVHLTATVLGLSALMAASPIAFKAVKWAGAAYLVWIGFQAILGASGMLNIEGGEGENRKFRALFWQGFLTNVLNPKVALFFLAFLPQFVDVTRSNKALQLMILGVTLNVLAIVYNLGLVYFASAATLRLRKNQKIFLWMNRAMGVMFILLGIRLVIIS
jgi:threonine/homoserine/homoserine lactone efflux protein